MYINQLIIFLCIAHFYSTDANAYETNHTHVIIWLNNLGIDRGDVQDIEHKMYLDHHGAFHI